MRHHHDLQFRKCGTTAIGQLKADDPPELRPRERVGSSWPERTEASFRPPSSLRSMVANSITDHEMSSRAEYRAGGKKPPSDNALFFRSWLDDPLRAGAFKPSSTDLACAMAARIDPSLPGPIVELGPGTGAVTASLVTRGVDPARLVLIEADATFCRLLRERWPRALVLHADAYSAPAVIRDLGEPAAAVVAGLPLLVRHPKHRLRLVLDCLRHAAPGAPFVQFTYFVRSPVPAPRPGLRAHGSSMVWRNLWPARVWTYRLAGHHISRAAKASI